MRQRYFSGLSRNTILLAIASFFSDISTEMLYPILPIFLTQYLRTSGSIVGLVDGFAQALQNMVQGLSGWLADKYQKRKSIALVGYFLSAASKPFIGFASVWPGVLAARSFDRMGAGIRSAPRDALLASSVEEKNRGKAFGLEGFGDNLGACLGPLLAVFLLISLQIDIHSIFYLALVPGLVAFCLVLFVKEGNKPVEAKIRIDLHVKQFPKAYWKYLLVTALFGIGNSSNSFLILQSKNRGIPLKMSLLIYAAFNLVAALISYPAGYLSDKWGRKTILFFAFVIFGITYLGFAVLKSTVFIALLFVFYGLYQGIFRSIGKAIAADLVPEKLRASGIGWYSMMVGFMGLLASIIAGLLWDKVSPSAVFFYGAVSALMGIVALMVLVPSQTRSVL